MIINLRKKKRKLYCSPLTFFFVSEQAQDCGDGVNWNVLQGNWKNSRNETLIVDIEEQSCTFENGETCKIDFDDDKYSINGIDILVVL